MWASKNWTPHISRPGTVRQSASCSLREGKLRHEERPAGREGGNGPRPPPCAERRSRHWPALGTRRRPHRGAARLLQGGGRGPRWTVDQLLEEPQAEPRGRGSRRWRSPRGNPGSLLLVPMVPPWMLLAPLSRASSPGTIEPEWSRPWASAAPLATDDGPRRRGRPPFGGCMIDGLEG